jgi:predicted nucleotidyltransferase
MTAAAAAPITAHPLLRRVRAELERLYGPRLVRVLLYGSRARGDAHEESDWDIAVILDGFDGDPSERERLIDLSTELLLETGCVVSLKPFSPEELSQRTLFMHNLRQEGVSL